MGSLVTAPAIDCGLPGAGACPDGKVHLLSAKPHSILMQYCLYFTNGQTRGVTWPVTTQLTELGRAGPAISTTHVPNHYTCGAPSVAVGPHV